jgi:large subunit ribosomal protein L6
MLHAWRVLAVKLFALWSKGMSINSANKVALRTSRIGRRPIAIPKEVACNLTDDVLQITGPKGTLSTTLSDLINIHIKSQEVLVTAKAEQLRHCRGSKTKLYHAIVGTTRANIANIVIGVTQGFEKKLILVGVGYRAQMQGNNLALSLGFSHPVSFIVPDGLSIETPSQTEIVIKGADKELVGLVAAQIRQIRSPEPYKGKGVRYVNEKIILKETKKK